MGLKSNVDLVAHLTESQRKMQHQTYSHGLGSVSHSSFILSQGVAPWPQRQLSAATGATRLLVHLQGTEWHFLP